MMKSGIQIAINVERKLTPTKRKEVPDLSTSRRWRWINEYE